MDKFNFLPPINSVQFEATIPIFEFEINVCALVGAATVTKLEDCSSAKYPQSVKQAAEPVAAVVTTSQAQGGGHYLFVCVCSSSEMLRLACGV
jgi:hypothetical protein